MFSSSILAGASGQGGGFYPFEIEQSLRFEAGDTAYLSRSVSASNRKTFTISCWLKRSELDGDIIMGRRVDGDNQWAFQFTSGGQLDFYNQTSGSVTVRMITNAVFRDVSAWYNIVLKVDVTTGTSANAIYVNGVEQSLSTDTSSNSDTYVNSAGTHYIGAFQTAGSYDGYMADFNFIDGQALDPTSFGEFKSDIWIPKDTAGLTFGTNGFRLQFGETTNANGFNTVTYTGNGGTLPVTNVGFEPDMVWLKSRSAAYDHVITDSVRGVEKQIIPNKSDAESQDSGKGLTSFDSDGFTLTLGTSTSYNNSGQTYVGWAWDAGSGSAASNTDGSITSTVKANTDYGFSVVKWTGTATAGTVGHGLSSAPEMIIVKNVSVGDQNWQVFHASVGNTFSGQLQSTTAFLDRTYWNDTDPTSSVFSISGQDAVNESGNTIIAYAFHSVTGYSKIGSFVGTGAAGNSITTGFKPAFVMWKSSTANTNWTIADNTRDTSNPITKRLIPNLNNAEDSSISVDFNDTGFEFNSGQANDNGETFIYMAFADTRNAAFWKDTSGQGNDWQPNNLVFSDVVLDSPTNNWCVWSPLTADSSAQFKEGNLEAAAADNRGVMASFNMPSGKWYWEVRKDANSTLIGIAPDTLGTEDVPNSSGENGVFYYFDGRVFQNGSSLGNYGSFTDGDIIGLTFDSSSREIKFYKNNSLAHTVTAAAGFTYAPAISAGSADAFVQGNFGQDSTFAGNETAGGNADQNGFGDFYYAPPSGFLSLCSFNLPEDDMETLKGETPTDYFNIVGYVGNDPSAQSITGLGFEPGWVWMKNNTATERHCLYDIVRGVNLRQSTNASLVDNDTGAVSSFDADGWTLAADNATRENTNGENYVAWSWKLGGSPANNTDGTVTSSVSAGSTNSDRKWVSVVTYTGTGATGTYGHGLSAAPKLIWTKCRNDATPEWAVFATGLGTGKYLELNNNSSPVTDANIYTSVDATTIGLGAENHADSPTNTSGDTYVSYCWTDSEGLCKSGTYTGNSQDPNGTFVYTGFRPRYLWIRSISGAKDGIIVDTFRSPINPNSLLLRTNTTQASSTDTTLALDILSNGFKLRENTATINNSSNDYVYLAIAEQPFKYANAR